MGHCTCLLPCLAGVKPSRSAMPVAMPGPVLATSELHSSDSYQDHNRAAEEPTEEISGETSVYSCSDMPHSILKITKRITFLGLRLTHR